MRDVSRAADVSVSTVANVLNNPELVAVSTRRRVEDAIRHVGYVRSGPARQLRGLPSQIVGVVILDQANPFYAALNRGIEDRLAADGCMLLACSTDVRADREAEILNALEEQAVRGIIITPTERNPDHLAGISGRGTPVVLADCAHGALDLCAVTVDHVLGGQLIAEHLISLGHRRFAFLTGLLEISPLTDRRQGIHQALTAAGLDPATAILDIAIPPARIFEAAAAAVDAILAAADPPTAIICFNDVAAVGVIAGLGRHGLRIPEDMSVVGYDDLQFAGRLNPTLTTIHQPMYQVGGAAAALLLDEGSPAHRHRELRFQPSLVVRDSTAAPAERSARR